MTESTQGESLDFDTLVHGLRKGENSAFETFVREFAPRAMRIARRILQNEADAADAVQDAFISAMSSINRFRAESQLATWFYRIATNAALMKLRSIRRRHILSIDELSPSYHPDGHRIEPKPAWVLAPEQILERSEYVDMVREKISQLPGDFRNVVLLRDIQQVSTADAATHLGVSESVVKTRLHRARQALRCMIEQELVGA